MDPDVRGRKHTLVGDPPEGAPRADCNRDRKNYRPGPLGCAGGRWGPAVLHVLGEGRPVSFHRSIHSAVSANLVEAAEPISLIETHGTKIAANETAAEDTSGEFGELSCLERVNVLHRDLCGLTHLLDPEPSLLTSPPEVVSECAFSALPHVCAAVRWVSA
jgi:hypothetical protein